MRPLKVDWRLKLEGAADNRGSERMATSYGRCKFWEV